MKNRGTIAFSQQATFYQPEVQGTLRGYEISRPLAFDHARKTEDLRAVPTTIPHLHLRNGLPPPHTTKPILVKHLHPLPTLTQATMRGSQMKWSIEHF
jgi:hypothetical protein